MARARIAVLISGRGSNLQALLDAAMEPGYPAEIVLVVSNRPDAAGLDRAHRACVTAVTVDQAEFGKGGLGRQNFEAALTTAISECGADFICLAGFMRLLSRDFVERWRGRLINIHPSLLPAFKGLDTHEAMIKAGVKIAGCTVHFVSAEMDSGPIIGQAVVPVAPGDDAAALAARILEEEHKLYPACLRLLCEGKARLGPDGRVEFDATVQSGAPLRNPI